MEKDFVHLHLHTEYSLLDGSGKIPEIINRAKELGMKSIAITDHGVMYGLVNFFKAAQEAGIKAILGCEVYVAAKSMDIKHPDKENPTHHLVLLVKNEKGYENLMQIVSDASIHGFYYKPRTDHEYLKTHSEGLIALSACLGGEVQSNILKSQYEKAKEAALFYKETFKDGFYLEIQNHGMEEQKKVNEFNINLAKELDIPLIVTNDVHYIRREDSKAHDILMCIQTSKTVDDPNRRRYPSDEFYLKSKEEMWEMFSYVPEALENTVKIAEECNFEYKFHESKLPKFPLPEGKEDPYEFLKENCYKGLIDRYECFKDLRGKELDYEKIKETSENSKEGKTVTERLEYELGIIKSMGYVDYFLIVWDFIKYAYDHDIPTGPGRGSGAGSIVAYTLGITKINPIKYNLIFERFLNPERVSMPDIDSDFCYERRQEVIDYVVRKYGEPCVSQIVTFGTMAAKMVLRDVGRAMNYSYSEVDRIAKMIPNELKITIKKALELNPEFKEAYENEERVKNLVDIAEKLEGLPRHTSTHAAGVVISSKPLVEYVPLQKNEDNVVAQFDMTTLEELGLLKMDFLGLRTLTVMADALKMIRANRGIDINLDNIDFDDHNVYKMIGEGKTTGVFQLESAGITSFMKELQPDNLEDIIAGISLYRPGPMSEIPKYLEGKRNPESVKYDTPELEDILDVTYGTMVYQEQVMEIVRKLAGYSMGRSDMVRRAMSKKKHHVMEEERKNFIYGIEKNGKVIVPGCIRNGIDEKAANKIFDKMMDFASYAFNKSHAAAYAVVAYQTAYLMHYYPTEMTAAMLNSVMGSNEKVAYYINFAESRGIQVFPPDINESCSKFTVKGDTIRFGMAAIKHVGGSVVEGIVKAREEKGKFESLVDFISKMDTSAINKRAVESLIKAGALDLFKIPRSQQLAVHEKIIDDIGRDKKNNIEGQMSLFKMTEELKNPEIKYPNIKEFNKRDLLAMEKEMTGLYITGHPLDEYKKSLKMQTSSDIIEINASRESLEEEAALDSAAAVSFNPVSRKIKDNDRVIIGGILAEAHSKVTRTNKIMAFMKIEDLTGSIEVIVFPKVYEEFRELCVEDMLVIIKGRVSFKEDEPAKIIAEKIEPLENIDSSKVFIKAQNMQEANEINRKLKETVKDSLKGNAAVYICVMEGRKKFKAPRSVWVSLENGAEEILKDLLGRENVKVTE